MLMEISSELDSIKIMLDKSRSNLLLFQHTTFPPTLDKSVADQDSLNETTDNLDAVKTLHVQQAGLYINNCLYH